MRPMEPLEPLRPMEPMELMRPMDRPMVRPMDQARRATMQSTHALKVALGAGDKSYAVLPL